MSCLSHSGPSLWAQPVSHGAWARLSCAATSWWAEGRRQGQGDHGLATFCLVNCIAQVNEWFSGFGHGPEIYSTDDTFFQEDVFLSLEKHQLSAPFLWLLSNTSLSAPVSSWSRAQPHPGKWSLWKGQGDRNCESHRTC